MAAKENHELLVTVRMASGSCMEVLLPSLSTVSDLKTVLASKIWPCRGHIRRHGIFRQDLLKGIYHSAIDLAFATVVLDDAAQLGHFADGHQIEIQMIISVERVCQDITHNLYNGGSVVRLKQLCYVAGQIARNGDDGVCDVLCTCIEHGFLDASLEALLNVAHKGNTRALRAVLWHADSDSRAVKALAELAEKGDDRAIRAVISCLNVEDQTLRNSAIWALSKLLEPNDPNLVDTMLPLLDAHDHSVRRAAGLVLGKAAKGNNKIIALAATRLGHPEYHMRASALELLAQVGAVGDSDIIGLMRKCLYDEEGYVIDRAMEALAHVSKKGDHELLDALSQCFRTGCASAHVFVRATAEVAGKGSERVISMMPLFLCDPRPQVRKAAVEALELVRRQDDQWAISRLTERLADEDILVRDAAAEALGKFEGSTLTIMSGLA